MQLELEHPTDATKIVPAKANDQGALLVAFAGEAPATATVRPTEPVAVTLATGVTDSFADMYSLTVVNDDSSTGDITITTAGVATYIKPGEAIGWDAATGAVLTVVHISVPAGTTGRMFGTRIEPELV